MPDEQNNQNDAEIHDHEPDAVQSRAPENERATLSGLLLLLGLLGGAAAVTDVGFDGSANPWALQCSVAAQAPAAVPSIQDQFRDAFTPGVIDEDPTAGFVKIGDC